MTRFSALLLPLVLLTFSCSKDTPKPAPELTGRWNAVSTTGFDYGADGQLLKQQTIPDQSFYLVITADSIHYRDIRDNNSWGSAKYTRDGQEIRYGRAQATITELTEHALTLRFKDANRTPNNPYQEVEDHYTR